MLVDAGQGAGGLGDCDAPRDRRMPALSRCDVGTRRAMLGRLVGIGLVPVGFLAGHGVSVASDRTVTRSAERSTMNGYSGISTVPWMLWRTQIVTVSRVASVATPGRMSTCHSLT